MKKRIFISGLILLSTSFLVSAANVSPVDSDLDTFNSNMKSLEQTNVANKLYVSTVADGFVDVTSAMVFTHSDVSIKRITEDQADNDKLTKVRSFTVYSAYGIDHITKQVDKHLNKDKPKYFSVKFRHGQGNHDSGANEYLAFVKEYN